MSGASDIALALIKKWEGCKLVAYQPVPGDVWTIGFGATGPDIQQGTRWTQEQADADLLSRLAVLERQVDSHVTFSLFDNELGACLSLAYNIGIRNFVDSTLLVKVNEGNMDEAADEFLKWDHFHGRVLPGLLNRRKDERAVFLGQSNVEGEQV